MNKTQRNTLLGVLTNLSVATNLKPDPQATYRYLKQIYNFLTEQDRMEFSLEELKAIEPHIQNITTRMKQGLINFVKPVNKMTPEEDEDFWLLFIGFIAQYFEAKMALEHPEEEIYKLAWYGKAHMWLPEDSTVMYFKKAHKKRGSYFGTEKQIEDFKTAKVEVLPIVNEFKFPQGKDLNHEEVQIKDLITEQEMLVILKMKSLKGYYLAYKSASNTVYNQMFYIGKVGLEIKK